MSQQIQAYSISAPGFYGLNTQDSPLDLNAGFALVATNCIIDQYGRIGSRQGWSRVNASSGNLGANDVKVIHELVQEDGSLTVLFTGFKVHQMLCHLLVHENGHIFCLSDKKHSTQFKQSHVEEFLNILLGFHTLKMTDN